jgi:AAA+ superfamily predicted ATPase
MLVEVHNAGQIRDIKIITRLTLKLSGKDLKEQILRTLLRNSVIRNHVHIRHIRQKDLKEVLAKYGIQDEKQTYHNLHQV